MKMTIEKKTQINQFDKVMRVAITECQKIVVENKKFIEELQKFKHAEKERDLKNKLRANENMAQRKNLKIK